MVGTIMILTIPIIIMAAMVDTMVVMVVGECVWVMVMADGDLAFPLDIPTIPTTVTAMVVIMIPGVHGDMDMVDTTDLIGVVIITDIIMVTMMDTTMEMADIIPHHIHMERWTAAAHTGIQGLREHPTQVPMDRQFITRKTGSSPVELNQLRAGPATMYQPREIPARPH